MAAPSSGRRCSVLVLGWTVLCSPASTGCIPVSAIPLKCGVATNNFPDAPAAIGEALQAGILSFWWNWDVEPRLDMSELSPQVAGAAQEAFTPMIWGEGPLEGGYGFLSDSSDYVMGYNEPDQFGPACAGESTKDVFGCTGDGGDYRSATSSGFAPLFDPAKAAQQWKVTLDALADAPHTVAHVVAPSMAQAAAPEDDCTADPSLPMALKYCRGWLQGFKRAALALECTSLNGEATNCWDAIDAIPIHAYARTAEEVRQKIKDYYGAFQEDFDGTGGRRKKVLWLTEVAMGSNSAPEISQFVDDLLNTADGLTNRDEFGFVERVSWFSEWSFEAFKVGSYTPRQYERWSSSLFEPTTGKLTPVGRRFAAHCGAQAAEGPAAELGDNMVV